MIKKFNEYNNNDYYEEIKGTEIYDKYVSIDDNDINFLKNKFPNIDFIKSMYATSNYRGVVWIIKFNYHGFEIIIRKVEDDYYILSSGLYDFLPSPPTYKCDQIDGLVKCIRDVILCMIPRLVKKRRR